MRSVRSRMAIVLAVVTFLPVVSAGAAIGWLAPHQANEGAKQLMRQASGSLRRALQQECYSLGQVANSVAMQIESRDLNSVAQSALTRSEATFVALIKDDVIVGSAGAVPQARILELVNSSCAAEINPIAGASGAPTLVEVITVNNADGYRLGSALVGTEMTPKWLSAQANALGLPDGTDVVVRCPDGRFASTATGQAARDLVEATRAQLGPQVVNGAQVDTREVNRGNGCRVSAAVTRPGFAGQGGVLAALLLGGIILGALLVLRLASDLTRPVLALTQAAERVARGDFSQRLSCTAKDEMGRLSGAFNEMTDELEQSIGELRRSRDLLRQNVARLGDTLERTHDLEGLLGTVLGAAGSATSARRGTAWLVEGGSVVARASVPASAGRTAAKRLPLGLELPGEVAVDGQPRRLSHQEEDPTSTLGGPVLAAPLRRGSTTVGVLVVERSPTDPEFDIDDEAMLVSLAGPAGIAVDNVLLHREAQRLSITDPLTGVGNLRHMTTTLAKEVERASRFGHPLSVLLLDLDHFKRVNDSFGHTVGDAVLRELARRLASCVREVDTVARYGGEEFVIVAPETDPAGARHLAARVCDAVRDELFVVGPDMVSVTVSVGIAALPTHGTASGDLVRAADEGLYQAKRAGRDQWQVAPLPPGASAEKLDLTAVEARIAAQRADRGARPDSRSFGPESGSAQ